MKILSLSTQKYATKMRERRARRRAAGRPSNNKRVDDVLSPEFIRRENHRLTGDPRFL